jgi:fatty acid desaturase
MNQKTREFEWPTLVMMIVTYAVWAIGTTLWDSFAVLSLLLTAVAITQFSSLQHEVLHDHPFADKRLNEALVFPALMLIVPFRRFRDLHLQHHHDPTLTDPFDDPESNFQAPEVWAGLSRPVKALYQFNNTLFGRMVVGPAISLLAMVTGDWQAWRRGSPGIAEAWVLNAIGAVPVVWWLVAVGTMPVWAYLMAVYFGFSLLKIRTYLEHRAHEAARARTVVIEDRGPLSVLFLNNNLHVVHHMHPTTPWYRLPALYASRRDHYLRRNEAYVYRSYAEIFRQHFFHAKDPVPHPIYPVQKVDQADAA